MDRKNKRLNNKNIKFNRMRKDKSAQLELDKNVLYRLRGVLLLIVAAMIVFLLLALCSYHANDTGWSINDSHSVYNLGGSVGAWCADILLSMFGFFAYILPLVLLLSMMAIYLESKNKELGFTLVILLIMLGGMLILVSGSGLSALFFKAYSSNMPEQAGGIIGMILVPPLLPKFGYSGTCLLLLLTLCVGLLLFFGSNWSHVFIGAKRFTYWLLSEAKTIIKRIYVNMFENTIQSTVEERDTTSAIHDIGFNKKLTKITQKDKESTICSSTSNILSGAKLTSKKMMPSVKLSKNVMSNKTYPNLKINLDILDDYVADSKNNIYENEQYLAMQKERIQKALADFGIKLNNSVGMIGESGPVVTRFLFEMEAGTKVSKLLGLSKDLARSLRCSSVRIVDVVPGKKYVGLELPNDHREIVRLKEVLLDDQFVRNDNPLIMGLGKNIVGGSEVVDLGKMPHLLVAGTTGSGKSVGVNAMLLSMLCKASPSELRFIMIDPKVLELSVYEGIPHLLTPVVTDMKEASNALRWCVKEMDRRYQVMAAVGVRNIMNMNKKIKDSTEPIKDPIWIKQHPDIVDQAQDLEPMPYIVVVVDEFADMIMVVGKKAEELIARLAQKARAAGIHLILATQRPSVDVITGLIKANIPTRIAFQVSSRIDSRTILDQQGAEQLLGHGDMLYLPSGKNTPIRIHGAFVDDKEVHAVASFWREQGDPEYINDVLAEDETSNSLNNLDEMDPLYNDAVAIVIETQRASISGVQRKLKIGYNRAARLIEEMEKTGIVSEMQTNGMREVLMDKHS